MSDKIKSMVQRVSPARVVTLYRKNFFFTDDNGREAIDTRFSLDGSKPYDSEADYELPLGWRVTQTMLSGGVKIAYFLTHNNDPIKVDDVYFSVESGVVCAFMSKQFYNFKRISIERSAVDNSDIDQAISTLNHFFAHTLCKFDRKRAFLDAADINMLNTLNPTLTQLLERLKR